MHTHLYARNILGFRGFISVGDYRSENLRIEDLSNSPDMNRSVSTEA